MRWSALEFPWEKIREKIRSRIGAIAGRLGFDRFRAGIGKEPVLTDYARVELRDINARIKVHPKVMDKLKIELGLKLDGPIARWNDEGERPGLSGTLAIEVVITEGLDTRIGRCSPPCLRFAPDRRHLLMLMSI